VGVTFAILMRGRSMLVPIQVQPARLKARMIAHTQNISLFMLGLLLIVFVLSKVISPLPLGERARVRGQKGISDVLQNPF
jgi:hypothetical protein